jgi:hypothetical protein
MVGSYKALKAQVLGSAPAVCLRVVDDSFEGGESLSTSL